MRVFQFLSTPKLDIDLEVSRRRKKKKKKNTEFRSGSKTEALFMVNVMEVEAVLDTLQIATRK